MRPGSEVSQPHNQRQAACPGNGASISVPATLGGGPLCPHEGQAGEAPGQVCLGREGWTDFGQTCGCLVGIQLMYLVCCQYVTTMLPPSPGSELLLGSTPAPHASCVLPRKGKAWDRGASHSPPFPLSSSLNRKTKVLKLPEKSLGGAGGLKAGWAPPRTSAGLLEWGGSNRWRPLPGMGGLARHGVGCSGIYQ